jgi:hypothetical protein
VKIKVEMLNLIGLLSISLTLICGFQPKHNIIAQQRKYKLKMVNLDLISTSHEALLQIPHWVQFAYQGLADAGVVTPQKFVCADFGQPGWAPFCFLNGNPVFNAFDEFQLFIQTSIISLRDFLKVFTNILFLASYN